MLSAERDTLDYCGADMGFISFNEYCYHQKLEEYENRPLSDTEIYEAKQLLKVLDDLTDEGYTNLNDRMEEDFSCLTRLRAVIRKAGASPFPIDHEKLSGTSYSKEEHELERLLGKLISGSKDQNTLSGNPFLADIRQYNEWIGYEEDTAYIFLIRDALLPYVYFSGRNRTNLYPWLVSRRFLEDITKTEYADDDIRLPLYEALESGHTTFDDFSAYCQDKIIPVLDEHPKLKSVLLDLLGCVKQERIIVIESGYMGTIPMMLKSLDDRVDFRLFTTAPFLYETYKDQIFCRKYEDIRRFETVYSQDLLLRYSSFHSGKFFVNVSADKSVQDKSLAEIREMLIGQQG